MVNCLEIFNRDILISSVLSKEIRTTVVIDMMNLILISPKLVHDEKMIKRFDTMYQFMNQEYNHLQFLTEMINHLECCYLELVDLYDIYNIVLDNQKLEMLCSKSITDYIILKDKDEMEPCLRKQYVKNETTFHDVRKKIIENNNQIEKIKRMEM